MKYHYEFDLDELEAEMLFEALQGQVNYSNIQILEAMSSKHDQEVSYLEYWNRFTS